MTQETRTKAGRSQVRTARAIGYVRVSRVGGRAGESFISPAVQRETIAAKASSAGLELVELVEDFDESGGKWERPGFQRALGMIERGEASVLVVAKLDRFARSVLDTHRALELVEQAGGRLIACDVAIEDKIVRSVYSAVAEVERDRITAGWNTAQARAVDRGVKISRTANLGYRFDDDHRLEPDGDAGLVLELFEARAGGASWSELEAIVEASGAAVTKSALRRLLSNRVYLGEVSFGEHVNPSAHPAIVPLELFERVQDRALGFAAGRARYDRAVKSLLAGIARCGSCGARMMKGGQGQRKVGVYSCRNRDCTARSSITSARLDAYVEARILEWAGATADELVELELPSASNRAELELALADAELGLEVYVTSPDGFGLEPALFARGVEARQEAIAKLRAELDALGEADEASIVRTTLREVWPELETAERRRLLDVVVDRIEVDRGSGHAGRARSRQPLEQRVRIILRDGSTL